MTSPAEAAAPDPAVQALHASVADMRGTARWITGAAAGVGGLVLAGGPLAVVSKLDDCGDVVAAVGGLLLALAGAAWTVWRTSDVLAPRVSTLDDLQKPELSGLRGLIARDPAAFYGPFTPDPAALQREWRLRSRISINLEARLARESDPERRRILEHESAAARSNALLAQRTRQRLLAWIHAWQVRQALRRTRREALLASLAVLAGGSLFFTAPLDNKETPPVLRVCIVTPAPTGGTATIPADACGG
ncbi:hypothetical protein ABTW95_24610 [Spirillospora sp. NPDC127506]